MIEQPKIQQDIQNQNSELFERITMSTPATSTDNRFTTPGDPHRPGYKTYGDPNEKRRKGENPFLLTSRPSNYPGSSIMTEVTITKTL